MSLILCLDRFVNKVKRSYRKRVFRAKIKCPHKRFTLVGEVFVINPNVKLGKNVTIYPNVMFFGDGIIDVGDNVEIGNGTIIYASKDGGVTIGKNSMIAAQCYIIDSDHGLVAGEVIRKQQNTVEPVFIGEDVWVATGAKVLKGATISNGAVIGANSVVKGEIPENAIAVGAIAKVKKYRE